MRMPDKNQLIRLCFRLQRRELVLRFPAGSVCKDTVSGLLREQVFKGAVNAIMVCSALRAVQMNCKFQL